MSCQPGCEGEGFLHNLCGLTPAEQSPPHHRQTDAHVCQEDWIPTGEMASCKIVPFLMSLRVCVVKNKTEQNKKTILKQYMEVNQ